VSRALIACILVVVLFNIVPLAHSSPPDSTWIAGIYDDADYDDIVGLVTSAEGCARSRLRLVREMSGEACIPIWRGAGLRPLTRQGLVTLYRDPRRGRLARTIRERTH
jgi:hypothetical protein